MYAHIIRDGHDAGSTRIWKLQKVLKLADDFRSRAAILPGLRAAKSRDLEQYIVLVYLKVLKLFRIGELQLLEIESFSANPLKSMVWNEFWLGFCADSVQKCRVPK